MKLRWKINNLEQKKLFHSCATQVFPRNPLDRMEAEGVCNFHTQRISFTVFQVNEKLLRFCHWNINDNFCALKMVTWVHLNAAREHMRSLITRNMEREGVVWRRLLTRNKGKFNKIVKRVQEHDFLWLYSDQMLIDDQYALYGGGMKRISRNPNQMYDPSR